jgi:hypothetical protein
MEVTLSAGQVLTANGDWAHCGLNGDVSTFGGACNYLPESWLVDGLPQVAELLDWYEHVHFGGLEDELAERVGADKSRQLMDPDAWHVIANQVPQAWVCGVFSAIRDDLAKYIAKKRMGRAAFEAKRAAVRRAVTADLQRTLRFSDGPLSGFVDLQMANNFDYVNVARFRYTLSIPELVRAGSHLVAVLQRLHSSNMMELYGKLGQDMCSHDVESPGGTVGQVKKLGDEAAAVVEEFVNLAESGSVGSSSGSEEH